MAVKVCAESDLQPGQSVKVLVNGKAVALVKDDNGTCHAIGDTCSHAEISLSEGFVEGSNLECWAHGARFDLNTGRALTLPATEPVPVYELSIVDGDIYVAA
ncbi:MAG: non-heme iron oxygenase ferredoxin subunit [Microbacteriaceae bacterium]|nr:MAG: non-heme iron oxygenase ferredoxin subunit [Microbacteriaceae bacterium]